MKAYKEAIVKLLAYLIYGYSLQATPRKPTWNPKMEIWKMMFFFKKVMFRFHVSFGDCNYHLESGYVWIHGLNVLHIW